ncbi:MAG: hypothetical protein LAO55_26575 [Acidobacteriia bacterium]|nr:hypothetical protein [Terriglobia bacterium]
MRRFQSGFWLLWVVVLLAGPIRAQISPGPLSRAHQDLEGATKCASCHNFGLGERGFKCLECHTEIAKRVQEKHGYHARAFNVSRGQADCARCHLEHNGRQFQITKFDRPGFKHDALTDFALAGKHKTLTCENCHNPEHIGAAVRAEIKVKDVRNTFLGLPTECVSCHKDQHGGQLGDKCANCHSQDAWKPAASFDHSRTAYPLTGRHQSIDCVKCHAPSPGSTTARYKGLSFSSCQNCHTDPHRGAFVDATFRGTCETCHVTAAWKSVRTDAGFNHDQTKFPLHGKHAETGCFKCHKSSDFKQPVAHEKCADCHEDVHKGQFAGRAAGSDCVACHTETSFKPSLYTREQHQESRFPLEGKHATMECAQCHKPAGRDAKYKLETTTCAQCHTDVHTGQFAGAAYANRCEACHTQVTFAPSTYSLARHAQTKFVLTGAHVAVLCADCHKPLAVAATPAARQYHFAEQNCTSCHNDPHRTTQACESCHNTNQWKEIRLFDHSATKFKLEGAHQSATCVSCHRPAQGSSLAKTKPTPDFFHTPTRCSECHEDVHGGQFQTTGADKECSTCHTISKWDAGAFDHNKTSYPLDGAHAKVRCAQCHTQQLVVDGRQIRVYRGTPTQCTSCHGAGK